MRSGSLAAKLWFKSSRWTFIFSGCAVEINADADGHARSVVGQDHVRPAVQRHRGFAFHARAVVQPALHQVRLQMPVFQIQAAALPLRLILRAA